MARTRLKSAFLLYNRRWFSSSLDPDTLVSWSSSLGKGVAGEYDPSDGSIRLAASLRPFDSVWRLTLLHEMAHLASEPEPAEHGPRWNRIMKRLAKAGAFNTLW